MSDEDWSSPSLSRKSAILLWRLVRDFAWWWPPVDIPSRGWTARWRSDGYGLLVCWTFGFLFFLFSHFFRKLSFSRTRTVHVRANSLTRRKPTRRAASSSRSEIGGKSTARSPVTGQPALSLGLKKRKRRPGGANKGPFFTAARLIHFARALNVRRRAPRRTKVVHEWNQVSF